MRSLRYNVSPVLILFVVCGTDTLAQQWEWPEKPENIQVLPEEWPGSRLRPVMRGFTRALGVRCSYCHVGEEGKPLSTYNFASDENPNKDRAREMLRMLGSINDHLKKIEVSGDERVNMWCHTCHRGRPRPMTLGEELSQRYREMGVDAALAYLSQLKEDYYGRGVYDFHSESTLNDFGYAVLETDSEGAIGIFSMNTEQFPKSANAWDSLADGYMKAGNKTRAEECYRKSLELDPGNQNAADMIEKIRREQ